jgi:hypothetical protein
MSFKYKQICTVQLKFSQKKAQENTEVTCKAVQKYIHIYTSLLSNLCYLNKPQMEESFLDNMNSSTD